MQTALENLSKDDLIALVKQCDQALLERNQVLLERDQVLAQRDEELVTRTAEVVALASERDYLKAQVEMLRRMQFGQKRERFEGDPNQTTLPFEVSPAEVEQQQEKVKEKIEYVRKRPNHHGRAKLPEHLPVEEVEIEVLPILWTA